jgi:N-acetylneuraminic acid mutarotase
VAILGFGSLAQGAFGQDSEEGIGNWPAPLLWKSPAKPSGVDSGPGEGSPRPLHEAIAATPLPLIAITPCRLIDTRGNGFTGQFGPPSLTAGSPRSFTLPGQCGIAGTAQAVSLNITVTNTLGPGFIKIFPQGGSSPTVSTLNYVAGQTVANAALVPLGVGGGLTIAAGVSGTDLIVDTNGYYDSSILITQVSPGTGLSGGGTSGNVTLGIAPGGVTSTELATNAVTSTKIAANAVTAGAIASGQVVKSVNGASDSVTISGAGATTVSTVGNSITVSSSPSALPSGTFVLGAPADTTLIGAGFSEIQQDAHEFWKSTATTNAPTARRLHTVVWTGTKMIVWGGYDDTTYLSTGGQYDPATDSWTPTASTGAPDARWRHTAVWTGSQMIVWGGMSNVGVFNTGGRYDPSSSTWTPTMATFAPSARFSHTAVWTGAKMIVWGGRDNSGQFNTGALYDPSGDTWLAMSTSGAPAARLDHTAVWTGTKMIVWGGDDTSLSFNTGGLYDPGSNTWAATTTSGAPAVRTAHTAVWTGTKMIIWGGIDTSGFTYLNTGGQYDPSGDSWTATTTIGAPEVRSGPTAVWTGSRMIVWGGANGFTFWNSGGVYDPVGDGWTATTTAGAPAGRAGHTAVWTGTKMIVWGGFYVTSGFQNVNLNTGGQLGVLSLYEKN